MLCVQLVLPAPISTATTHWRTGAAEEALLGPAVLCSSLEFAGQQRQRLAGGHRILRGEHRISSPPPVSSSSARGTRSGSLRLAWSFGRAGAWVSWRRSPLWASLAPGQLGRAMVRRCESARGPHNGHLSAADQKRGGGAQVRRRTWPAQVERCSFLRSASTGTASVRRRTPAIRCAGFYSRRRRCLGRQMSRCANAPTRTWCAGEKFPRRRQLSSARPKAE